MILGIGKAMHKFAISRGLVAGRRAVNNSGRVAQGLACHAPEYG